MRGDGGGGASRCGEAGPERTRGGAHGEEEEAASLTGGDAGEELRRRGGATDRGGGAANRRGGGPAGEGKGPDEGQNQRKRGRESCSREELSHGSPERANRGGERRWQWRWRRARV